MSTKHKDIFDALARPFRADELKSFSKGGKSFKYITARTVMNRLDEVLGPESWWDEYVNLTEHSAICRLSIRLPDGQVLVKCDAGGSAGMADGGDDDKSIISDAFKRAAVKFGVGRYLYQDGVASLVAYHMEVTNVRSDGNLETVAVDGGQGREQCSQTPPTEATQGGGATAPEGPVPSWDLRRRLQPEAYPESTLPGTTQEVDPPPFWDYMVELCDGVNREFDRRLVDPRDAVKSVLYLASKAGHCDYDVSQKRTQKQWREIANQVAESSPEAREWMGGLLQSHIKIAIEKAGATVPGVS